MEDIRSEFYNHKVEVNRKLESQREYFNDSIDSLKIELLSQVKPVLTTSNKIVLLLAIIGYAIMSFKTLNNFDIRVDNNKNNIKHNSNEINKILSNQEKTSKKIDKIYDIVLETRTDVAVLKSDK
tara:strand:+ start:152 stop:526 length:375 start_codon:yes stop_codon:yes gene_type:complete